MSPACWVRRGRRIITRPAPARAAGEPTRGHARGARAGKTHTAPLDGARSLSVFSRRSVVLRDARVA
eukprot:66622-Prymnesium_polylepis.1